MLAVGLAQMECAKSGFATTFSTCISDNHTLKGLPAFDFQPAFAPPSGLIGAVTLFGHDAFEAHLFHRLEKGRAFFDDLAYSIRRIFFDGIFQPCPPACQRFTDDGTAIQVKTIE